MVSKLTLLSVDDLPTIGPGDDLAALIMEALVRADVTPATGDILVVAQKIVSKSAGLFVDLRTVVPGPRAVEVARRVEKDPRLVEVILSESRGIIRQAPGVLITEHRSGWIMANAGIDASNVSDCLDNETVLLLPPDPDGICETLREKLAAKFGTSIGVLINDSFGRPWRLGTTGVALGAAGIPSLWDRRGVRDIYGRPLMVTQQAIADELASAASLLQGQAGERRPVILIRGFEPGGATPPPARPAGDLIRDADQDLFR